MVHGEFSYRVQNPETLITGLVGMGRVADGVSPWMKEQVLKIVRDRIAELMVKNKWPLLDVTSGAYTEEIEKDVLAGLGDHVKSYGIVIVRLGNFVVGIDEAGRGPWAGPVVVAAVILNPNRIPEGLNDSKVLTAEAREDRYAEIMATACVSISIGNVRRIDRINILQATMWGMRAAYRGLQTPAATALIDGNIVPLGASVRGSTLANVNDSLAVLQKDGARDVLLMHPDIDKKPSKRERP